MERKRLWLRFVSLELAPHWAFPSTSTSISSISLNCHARLGKVRRSKARKGKERRGKARQSKARYASHTFLVDADMLATAITFAPLTNRMEECLLTVMQHTTLKKVLTTLVRMHVHIENKGGVAFRCPNACV